jgi:hypothetical protein
MSERQIEAAGTTEHTIRERPRRSRPAGLGCLLYVAVMVALIALPYALWWLRPPAGWTVVVVDKTVPHPTYREHAALFWTLRHFKARRVDGGSAWDLARDYIGYYPAPASGSAPHGRPLEESDLIGADLLILADTYGVYTADYARGHDGHAAHQRSRLIFGGLRLEEVNAVERFVERGGALVAEFNTFASPTGGAPGRRLQDLLGIRWSGWSGRYFVDLGDRDEVPDWARAAWGGQHDRDWEFAGPGYLLVHEGGEIVVLEEGADVEPGGLRVVAAETDDPLLRGVRPGVPFRYWFDVVEPIDGTRVLMRYRFELTERGLGRLRDAGAPGTFPAVLVAAGSPRRIYLAGDFSDNPVDAGPSFVQFWPTIRKYGTALGARLRPDQTAFFWNVYVPLMGNILSSGN